MTVLLLRTKEDREDSHHTYGGTKMDRRLSILTAFSLIMGAPWMFAQENRFEFNVGIVARF
jgi:hypothetical protein